MTKLQMIKILKQDFGSDVEWDKVIYFITTNQKKLINQSSWDKYENVDRMGGSFTQSEIDDSRSWR